MSFGLGYTSGGGGAGPGGVVLTRAGSIDAEIPASQAAIKTSGYAAAGDGGDALYVKVVASTPGGFQSADGAWWQYVAGTSGADVRAFGAKCDGTTDDAAAINTAILASVDGSSRGATVTFPSGRKCAIGSTVAFDDFYGGLFEGNNVTFVWIGDAISPMFRIRNVQFYTFRDFNITNTVGTTLLAGIQSDSNAGTRVCTGNRYYNVRITSVTSVKEIGKGWWYSLGTAGNANNDFNIFVSCNVFYTTVAGWSIEHSESTGHLFLKCNYSNCTIGVAGGSFTWIGGGGGASTVADFQISQIVGSPLIIVGVHSEQSARFIEMTSGAGTLCKPINISECEITTSDIHADAYIMVFNGSGPFTVDSTRFSGANACRLKVNSSNLCVVNLRGCAFDTPSSSSQVAIIDAVGAGPFSFNRKGNIYRDAGSLPATRADEYNLSIEQGQLIMGVLGAEDVGIQWAAAAGMKVTNTIGGYAGLNASVLYTRNAAGDQRCRISGSSFAVAADGAWGFSSTSTANGTADIGCSRGAAGRLFIGDGNPGDKSAYVDAKSFVTAPVAVASLPAAATAGAGARMSVNDALTPAFGAAVVAGGAVTVPVYSDGSAWLVG